MQRGHKQSPRKYREAQLPQKIHISSKTWRRRTRNTGMATSTKFSARKTLRKTFKDSLELCSSGKHERGPLKLGRTTLKLQETACFLEEPRLTSRENLAGFLEHFSRVTLGCGCSQIRSSSSNLIDKSNNSCDTQADIAINKSQNTIIGNGFFAWRRERLAERHDHTTHVFLVLIATTLSKIYILLWKVQKKNYKRVKSKQLSKSNNQQAHTHKKR